jgi:osmotically-inducible protein OsmY
VQFVPSALQTDLRDIIQRSLPGRDKITVAVNGDVVTLRGEVASVKERSFVERLLRLEPGVRNLNNQLTVAGAASQ